MNDADRLRYRRIALVVIGGLSVVGIYATLGVFLILAAGDPLTPRGAKARILRDGA